MKKGLKLLLVLVMALCVLSGCAKDKNSKPEEVAKSFIKRLGKSDYEGIGNLFYHEGCDLWSDEVFKEVIKSKNLDIAGNKSVGKEYKVVEATTNDKGLLHSEVSMSIDNGVMFNLDTVKVGDKWYVYDPSVFDGNIMIVVPKGSKVIINGTTIDDKYYDKIETTISLTNPRTYRSETFDTEIEGYMLKNLLEGTYKMEVTTDKTYIDNIYTKKNRSQAGTDNFDVKLMDDTVVYYIGGTPNLEANEEETKATGEFVKEYWSKYVEGITKNTKFDDLLKEYTTEESYETIKKYYENEVIYRGNKANHTGTDYYSKSKVGDYLVNVVYKIKSDTYVVYYSYRLDYSINRSGRDYDNQSVFHLRSVVQQVGDKYYVVK